MKFTLNWLKQHLDTQAPLGEIAARLTALGLEVESVQDRAAQLAPFVIARIVSAEQHPNADRLRVCVVDNGKEKINVVCGAPNARAGLIGVFAPVGTYIPGSDITLKKGVIRGAESNGMMCSAAELQTAEESDGIIELPADAPIGQPYASWAGLDDPVIEIKLTPNRSDCAGVRGIARDLAAAGLGVLKPLPAPALNTQGVSGIKVRLDFPAGAPAECPHFVGIHLRHLRNGDSPGWLQDRLRAIGLRPISALVDITNYLTFDLARPLHVFDAQKLKGDLTVRHARPGDKLEALNDKDYELPVGAVVIADDGGVVSLGGIMGGRATGCDGRTTDVFLEAAWFAPSSIARTGRQLQIGSDARYRFERGVDPAFTRTGAELAAQLIVEICGTAETTVSASFVAGSAPDETRHYRLRLDRCKTLVGVDVPIAEQKRILDALGCRVEEDGDVLRAEPPSWRPDIQGEADLVEEVIRVHGFDAIPALSLPRREPVAKSGINSARRRAGVARRALGAQGLLEAVTWSFMPAIQAADYRETDDALRLKNPISADLDMMRPSILGNLLDAARRNAARGYPDLGLFEIGPVYHGARAQDQKLTATLLRAGQTRRHWTQAQRPVDLFDVKADVLAVLSACGVNVSTLQCTTDAPAYYHPGQSACLRQGPNLLASFGMLHPALLQKMDVTHPAAGAEIWLEAIPALRANSTARPPLDLPPLQAITRDFAFVVDEAVSADKLAKTVRQVDKILITDVQVFDVYRGAALEAGKKSLALSVTLQPRDQSLTDEKLEQISSSVTAAVSKALGGVLR